MTWKKRSFRSTFLRILKLETFFFKLRMIQKANCTINHQLFVTFFDPEARGNENSMDFICHCWFS